MHEVIPRDMLTSFHNEDNSLHIEELWHFLGHGRHCGSWCVNHLGVVSLYLNYKLYIYDISFKFKIDPYVLFKRKFEYFKYR